MSMACTVSACWHGRVCPACHTMYSICAASHGAGRVLVPHPCRRDAEERPELSRGTVEYVAPTEYMVRVCWGKAALLSVVRAGAGLGACSETYGALS